MTRVDLTYYVLMDRLFLVRSMKALRAVLRWLKHIEGYRQVVSTVEEKDDPSLLRRRFVGQREERGSLEYQRRL